MGGIDWFELAARALACITTVAVTVAIAKGLDHYLAWASLEETRRLLDGKARRLGDRLDELIEDLERREGKGLRDVGQGHLARDPGAARPPAGD